MPRFSQWILAAGLSVLLFAGCGQPDVKEGESSAAAAAISGSTPDERISRLEKSVTTLKRQVEELRSVVQVKPDGTADIVIKGLLDVQGSINVRDAAGKAVIALTRKSRDGREGWLIVYGDIDVRNDDAKAVIHLARESHKGTVDVSDRTGTPKVRISSQPDLEDSRGGVISVISGKPGEALKEVSVTSQSKIQQ